MNASTSPFPCETLGGSEGALRLRCLRGFTAPAGITALLNGMEIGHLALPEPVAEGAELAVPLARLPRVALPAEIRLAAGEAEIAPAFALASAHAAVALCGPGTWRAEDVAVHQGVVQGRLLNAANALAEPIGFARVNGTMARPLLLGQPATLGDGGATWPFQLPLLAEDLLESGCSVVLHVSGQEAPLASLAWARAWAGEEARRLVALEARLQELEQAAEARAAQLAAEQQRLDHAQRERIDAFIEYAGALLLDRQANTASAAPAAAVPAEGAGQAALRDLVSQAAEQAVEPVALSPLALAVSPGGPAFSFGWHGLEQDDGGEFRWMGDTGVVTNPAPHRLVTGLRVELRHVYGSELPSLQARLDGVLVEADVSGEPGGFLLRLAPAGAAPCRMLRLQSLRTGSPAEDGVSTDARRLSVAVARVVWEYAA